MLDITEELHAELLRHAYKHRPEEMCGAIVRNEDGTLQFIKIANVHAQPKDYFSMDMSQLAAIEDDTSKVIVAYAHSHPDDTSTPSAFDRAQCNLHGKPYVIVGTKDDSLTVIEPHTVPLLGRQYVHAMQDCYSLVQDYYLRELGITLPDFERAPLWWTDKNSESLYEKGFTEAGFVAVPKTTIQALNRHDVLIAYWGTTLFPNHAMVYLGDNGKLRSEQSPDVVGERLYLHHLYDSVSCRTLLGESKFQDIAFVLRHKSLL